MFVCNWIFLQWTPPNVSVPLLNLVDNIFQLKRRGWLRWAIFMPFFLTRLLLLSHVYVFINSLSSNLQNFSHLSKKKKKYRTFLKLKLCSIPMFFWLQVSFSDLMNLFEYTWGMLKLYSKIMFQEMCVMDRKECSFLFVFSMFFPTLMIH